jgi:hypothetical protein
MVASLLDGGKVGSSELIGRPAAVFLWCSCSRTTSAHVSEEATARADEMAFVLASLDEAGTPWDLSIRSVTRVSWSGRAGRCVEAWA